MLRAANPRATFSVISIHDPAIAPTPKTARDRFEKSARTSEDEKALTFADGEAPARFTLRTLRAHEAARLLDAQHVVGAPQGTPTPPAPDASPTDAETTRALIEMRMAATNIEAFRVAFVAVEGMVDASGAPVALPLESIGDGGRVLARAAIDEFFSGPLLPVVLDLGRWVLAANGLTGADRRG